MSDLITDLNVALEGRYRVEGTLGEGGMATVFLADDRKHDRKVALKVLKPELTAVVGADRFLAEIKTTANLQHPHILPLYDSGEAGGFLYYVMPYVAGESLRERLDRERQLPVADAVEIAKNIAEALDYAHRQGVIHRDVKPANVLLGDGKPVVADFGIALAVGTAGHGRLTETGLSVGTPHYMSPEQATGDESVGSTTDIYSLGCVLYEMLVGEPPHSGSTAQAILGKIISGEVAAAAKHRPTVPANVDAAVRRALEPLPADRFPRARDFASALADSNYRHGRESDPAPSPYRGVWKRLSMVTLTTTIMLAGWVGWLLLRPDAPGSAVRISVKAPGAQVYSGGLALSPDGSFLIYAARDPEEESSRLWMRRWNSLDATPVAGSAGAIAPAVSPDGREIAFSSPGGVRVTPVHGGDPRTIAHGSLAGTAWSNDGTWVYFADLFTGLKRVPAAGGPVEVLTVVDTAGGDRGHADPQALPGGKGLLFAVVTTDGVEIAALDFDTGEVKRLGPGTSQRYSPTGHVLYIDDNGTLLAAPFDLGTLEISGTPEPLVRGMAMANPPRGFLAISELGSLVYLMGGTSDHLTPVWVARNGTAAAIDPDWRTTGLVRSVALSPNADRLAISMQDSTGSYHLWIKHLERGPFTRLTFGGSVNWRPTWSSDGRYLTFISNRSGQSELWAKRADGSGPAEILVDRETPVSDAFYSRDLTWLIFEETRDDAGTTGVFAMRPPASNSPIPIVLRSGFNAHSPELSPDGRWLAYVSDESGREEVYVRPFPEAESGLWPVSTGGGTAPVWGRSGRELFYRNAANELVAVQIRADSSFAWGRQDVLFPTGDFFTRDEDLLYDVHPDGRRFVMLRSSKEGPWELILVQGLSEELERLWPAGDR